MLKQISELKAELEQEMGEKLTTEEIAYLEQIQSIQDLSNYGQLADLAYDAARAFGLSEEAAENLVADKSKVEAATQLPEDLEALKNEYKALVRNVNTLLDIVHEAEYQTIEEVSREGFASDTTREKVNRVQAELSEAKTRLETFKYQNQDSIAQYKAMKKEEKERKNEELFEKFWNN